MRISLRNRILLTFVLVIIGFSVVGAVMGTYFINKTTIMEEQRRVSVDLRSAWSVLQGKGDELTILVSVLGTGQRVANAYSEPDRQTYRASLESVRRQFKLDFLTLIDNQGRVILRTLTPFTTGDDLSNDPFVLAALGGQAKSGFYLLDPERLKNEGGDLVERAFVVFEPTSKAKLRAKTSEDSGLALIAAAPVVDQAGRIHGAIYAGTLLNRNNALVDQIRSLVFEGKLFEGRPVGAVTIFQWDVRVATNVILPNGNRALGTRVSAEVYDKVLENNSSWYDRAFVVNDWYISAYDPIHDCEGRVVGILYVGVLAKKYDEIKANLWKIYGGVSLVGVLLIVFVGLVFARRLTGSVDRLAQAALRFSGGELTLRVPEPRADDELRDLVRAFNSMAGALFDREESLKNAHEQLARTNATLQQLNRNYLEMLGFVSHELKNTLGVIFTSAKTLAAGMAGSLTENQAILVGGITRNIDSAVTMTRNYLDLTRIEKGELSPNLEVTDLVRDVILPVLEELKGLAEQKKMPVELLLPTELAVKADPSLMKIAVKNLLGNAFKYGKEGGEVRVKAKREEKEIFIEVRDEGSVLTGEQIEKLFGKFVRLHRDRETEYKGTGLGLFITKDIIEKHGGRIWAENEDDRWMKFIFTLPPNED